MKKSQKQKYEKLKRRIFCPEKLLFIRECRIDGESKAANLKACGFADE